MPETSPKRLGEPSEFDRPFTPPQSLDEVINPSRKLQTPLPDEEAGDLSPPTTTDHPE